MMIGVLIVPTGIGAEIGGHAGDANPAAKLIGACCDKLITHPNVVNASDINEMPPNTLYVEGSLLDRFLEGNICLREVTRPNRILVAVNRPVTQITVNAVSAARATIGIDTEVVELKTPLRMIARSEAGPATGDVFGYKELVEQVSQYSFDVLAIHTAIEVGRDLALNYYRCGGVNPWGGVEAKASRMIADLLNLPVAHAPLESVTEEDEELFCIFNEQVDPRIAPEAISNSYLHCVLKGLHRAPAVTRERGLSVEDVDFMISPYGCWGRPHRACMKANVPIIAVEENATILDEPLIRATCVKNYWEAAGFVMAMKAGVSPLSVRRPLRSTKIRC